MRSKPLPGRLTRLLGDLGPVEVSGRRPAIVRAPPTSERIDALVLDVRRLQLLGALTEGTMGQLAWGVAGEGSRPSALYSFRRTTLTVHEVMRGGSLDRIEAAVEVEALGIFSHSASRPWLRCPHERQSGVCGRRVTKLLLLDGDTAFRCRFCAGRRRKLRPIQLTDATCHSLAVAGSRA